MSEQVEMEEESTVIGSANQTEKKRFEVKKVLKKRKNSKFKFNIFFKVECCCTLGMGYLIFNNFLTMFFDNLSWFLNNFLDIVVDNCAICRNHIMDLCKF